MRLAVHDDVERFVVIVPAGFTLWHGSAPIKLRAARVGAAKGHPRRGTRRPAQRGIARKIGSPGHRFHRGARKKMREGRGALARNADEPGFPHVKLPYLSGL